MSPRPRSHQADQRARQACPLDLRSVMRRSRARLTRPRFGPSLARDGFAVHFALTAIAPSRRDDAALDVSDQNHICIDTTSAIGRSRHAAGLRLPPLSPLTAARQLPDLRRAPVRVRPEADARSREASAHADRRAVGAPAGRALQRAVRVEGHRVHPARYRGDGHHAMAARGHRARESPQGCPAPSPAPGPGSRSAAPPPLPAASCRGRSG